MMEGSCTLTLACTKWLALNSKTLFLDINDKGCNGQTITWELRESRAKGLTQIGDRLMSFIREGLTFQVDYIDTPLIQGIHVNVLNKNKCGCGISFS